MYDLYQFILEHWGQPIRWTTLGAFILFLIDRFGRKLITNQVKRLFHIKNDSDFKKYIANQQRIESKIDAILNNGGIVWSGQSTISTPTQTRRNSSSQLLQADTCRGNPLRRMTDMQINKAILLPLLAAIATFIKSAFGYEISDEHVNGAADLILFGLMLSGIFIHPRKEKKSEVQTDAEHTDLSDAY